MSKMDYVRAIVAWLAVAACIFIVGYQMGSDVAKTVPPPCFIVPSSEPIGLKQKFPKRCEPHAECVQP